MFPNIPVLDATLWLRSRPESRPTSQLSCTACSVTHSNRIKEKHPFVPLKATSERRGPRSASRGGGCNSRTLLFLSLFLAAFHRVS